MKVLRKFLKLHAYKIQLMHAINDYDKTHHFFLWKIIFYFQPTFHLSNHVDCHNYQTTACTAETLVFLNIIYINSLKIIIWCTLTATKVIRLFCFAVLTVSNLDMLQKYAVPSMPSLLPARWHIYWVSYVCETLDNEFPEWL